MPSENHLPEVECPEDEPGKPNASNWNSLEITKLVVSASIPLTILMLSLTFQAQQRKHEEQRATFDQVVKERLDLWNKIAVPLNQIYCYFLCVGDWKDISPADVIQLKRRIDQTVYAYRPFFSAQFHITYDRFIKAAFDEDGGGWADDAPLRTLPVRPKEVNLDKDTLKKLFTSTGNEEEIHNAYFQLLQFISSELHLQPNAIPKVPPYYRRRLESDKAGGGGSN